jgi:hypothetical protein
LAYIDDFHISQAFQQHQACPIPIPNAFGITYILKLAKKWYCLAVCEEILCATTWITLAKG